MSSQQTQPQDWNTSAAVTISNGVLLAALIFLFLVVVFVFLLYLYAKRYMVGSRLLNSAEPRFMFVSDNLPVLHRGLNSEVLQSLPVKVFDAKEFKEGLECAVCLSDIDEGEEVRILPKCSHGFHVKCIDMWFHSHSTCPLCRSPVVDSVHAEQANAELVQAPSLDAVSREGYITEARVLPTNVLFWGTQDEVTTGTVQEGTSSSNNTDSRKREGGAGTLVIDIPRRAIENMVPSPISPLPPSVMPLEEMKSPVSARFRSLKRLLSRGKQVVGPSASPRGGDIEQGIVYTPKTPRSFRGSGIEQGIVHTPKTPRSFQG